jgi:hypothetical protein
MGTAFRVNALWNDAAAMEPLEHGRIVSEDTVRRAFLCCELKSQMDM